MDKKELQTPSNDVTAETHATHEGDASTAIPHVPPCETTLESPVNTTVATAIPSAATPPKNDYCNGTEPNVSAAPQSQIPLPRPEPSKDHNAYRDEPSAISEAVRKKHFLLKGVRPMEGEPPHAYNGRMMHELRLLHTENVAGLKSSTTKLSLLLLLYMVIFQVVYHTVPMIAGGFDLVQDEGTLSYTLMIIIMYVLIYPVTFPLIIHLGNIGETHKVKTFLRKPQCSVGYILKWFIIATGCTYVINIAFTVITQIIGYDNGATAKPFTSVLDGASQLVILCVFAPIFEELLFRGVMLSHHMKYGAWFACVITSLYFGFFHMNLQQLFYTFVGGLFMSMVVLKTGSLISSIIMHAMLNFTSFLQLLSLSLIDNYDAYMNGVDLLPKGHPAALVLFAFTTLLPWIFMIAAVIMLIVELVTNRRSFRMPEGDSGLTTREKVTAYLSTPAVWVTFVVALAVIVYMEYLMYLNNLSA